MNQGCVPFNSNCAYYIDRHGMMPGINLFDSIGPATAPSTTPSGNPVNPDTGEPAESKGHQNGQPAYPWSRIWTSPPASGFGPTKVRGCAVPAAQRPADSAGSQASCGAVPAVL
jgi:hypothetical protein